MLRCEGGRDVIRPGAEGTGGLFSCWLGEQKGRKQYMGANKPPVASRPRSRVPRERRGHPGGTFFTSRGTISIGIKVLRQPLNCAPTPFGRSFLPEIAGIAPLSNGGHVAMGCLTETTAPDIFPEFVHGAILSVKKA